MTSMRHQAARLIRHYADSAGGADRRTSMADSRIALCLAQGTAMADIDPASGYDFSLRAYHSVRDSWIRHVKFDGFNGSYDAEPISAALAAWQVKRPAFTAGDDWLAAGIKAHRRHWDLGLGRACNRSSCQLHDPAERRGTPRRAALGNVFAGQDEIPGLDGEEGET